VSAGHCKYCGEPVDTSTGYQRVEGWVHYRHQGGTNHIVAQERKPDEWACSRCIQQIKRGRTPQDSLL
jgi:hypothetical protein